MVTKYEAGTLDFTPNCSLDLLRQQKRHMGEYLHDLEIRAEVEGASVVGAQHEEPQDLEVVFLADFPYRKEVAQ